MCMALRQLRRLPAARFLALVAFFGVCMGATKRVSTGKELVEAFADSNVDVALIVVPALYPSDADFSGFDLPVRVTRDIVLLGSSAAPEDWPLLDLGGITSPKVLLSPNRTMVARHLVVYRTRAVSVDMAPGVDMLMPLQPGTIAFVAMEDGAVIHKTCNPPGIMAQSLASPSNPRPRLVPGKQTLVDRIPQPPTCINTTDETVPAMRRCWLARGTYDDLAVFSAAPDERTLLPVPDNMISILRNVTFLCPHVQSMECVLTLGPIGCWFSVFGRDGTALLSPPPAEPLLLTGSPSSGKSTPILGPVLGGVLGGLAALALVAALFVLLLRRRRGSSDLDSKAAAGDGEAAAAAPPAAGGHPPAGPQQGLGPEHAQQPSPEGASEPAHLPAAPSPRPGAEGVDVSTPEPDDMPEAAQPVVVTPLTPWRPDVALGVDPGHEVELLPVTRGKGTYGRVVEGRYRGQHVAVKVVAHAWGSGGAAEERPELLKSFAHEVEVLGRCQHPNVVRLLAACLTPPRLCLVMELMETSLDKLLHGRQATQLPLHTVLDIAQDIASGLAYLHPTIVHRDLKPGNVLINGAGSSRPVAKIADFGLSRLRSTVAPTTNPEAGTPPYTAPECFDTANKKITHMADMYSFGCLLYEMLSGSRPWAGCHMVAIAHAVTTQRQRPPLHDVPGERCPPALRRLVVACWEADPRRRPAAEEAAKELALIRQQLPASPSPSGPADLAPSNSTSPLPPPPLLPAAPSPSPADAPLGAAAAAAASPDFESALPPPPPPPRALEAAVAANGSNSPPTVAAAAAGSTIGLTAARLLSSNLLKRLRGARSPEDPQTQQTQPKTGSSHTTAQTGGSSTIISMDLAPPASSSDSTQSMRKVVYMGPGGLDGGSTVGGGPLTAGGAAPAGSTYSGTTPSILSTGWLSRFRGSRRPQESG